MLRKLRPHVSHADAVLAVAQPEIPRLVLRLCLLGCVLAATLLFAPVAHAAGGAVQAWGENDYGALGTGTATNTGGCNCINAPTPVSGLADAAAVAAGRRHSLALRSDGTVLAWGDNQAGELGKGTTSPAFSATPAPVLGLSNVAAIAAGDGDFSLALRRNGTVVAWGANDQGQLGDAAVNSTGCMCIASPVEVSGLSHVVAIAAGNSLGVALLANGTVRTWGLGHAGQLGNGTVLTTGCRCSDTPVAVSGLSHVVAIAGGDYFGLALRSDGRPTAWGDNSNGALGTGTAATSGCYCSATPAPVSGVVNAAAVAAGYEFSLALLPSGAVRAWGWNVNGQLGNGSFASNTGCQCVASPAAVTNLAGADVVAAGYAHAVTRLRNGTLMTWGDNNKGQLGNGTTSTSGCTCITSPVAVSAIGAATAVAGGGNHSLAITGPARALTVSTAGAGKGVAGGDGILCPGSCTHRYPDAGFAALRADPAAGSKFAGFSGACRGTGPCMVQMSRDKRVVATFGPPKGTKITAAKFNRKTRSARFTFTAPGAITGFECQLTKSGGRHHRSHFSKCAAAKRYRHLVRGSYTLKVRARDIAGADRTPAKRRFKI